MTNSNITVNFKSSANSSPNKIKQQKKKKGGKGGRGGGVSFSGLRSSVLVFGSLLFRYNLSLSEFLVLDSVDFLCFSSNKRYSSLERKQGLTRTLN